MKKIKFLILPLALAVTALTACGGEPVNKGPELTGVNDVTCLANSTVDLLDGVRAFDYEDGDITPDLQITVTPEVAVEDGFATFPKAGEYDVCYEIRDSGGKLARTTVKANVVEREVYMDNMLTNGFSLKTDGSVNVIKEGLNGSAYSFKVSGGEIAEDVRLTRTYTLVTGAEYTFKYEFECNLSGKIKVAADGKAFAEQLINADAKSLEFNFSLPLKKTDNGEILSETTEIELWLGALEGDLEFSLIRSETKYMREGTVLKELAENFNFNGKIINRDDKAHAVYASEDGKSATLEVTNPTGEIWQVGMFVETGIRLEAGNEYIISFDMDSRLGNPYQVCIQHDQWKDSDAIFIDDAQGHVSKTISATESFSGNLWLFIRSGVYANNVTISNLSVKVKESGYKIQSFGISGVEAGGGEARCEYGKLIFDIPSFGADWGNNELRTPSFELSGAAANYVITFKAKSSQPVKCVFLAHDELASEWTTFVWKEIKITEKETAFYIKCDDKNLNSSYKFFWQFGTLANAGYSDVTVEISDVKICNEVDLKG